MNGTSDLPFERYKLDNGKNLMDNNPNVQFIDYTKITNRLLQKLPKKWLGRRVIDGDVSDLRHLDPKKVVVGLIAKGKAKKDFNGFVQDV